MQQENDNEVNGFPLPPPCRIIALAIKGGNRSTRVIQFALAKFVSDKNITFKLLHIRQRTTHVPTSFMAKYQNRLLSRNNHSRRHSPDAPLHTSPDIYTLGNSISISQVRDDVADAYIKEMDWKTNEMLSPYKKLFSQKKIEVDTVIIESDNVTTAIAKEVAKDTINMLVIGASSSRKLTWKDRNLSSKIAECIPNFCAVYAYSNGELLLLIRPAEKSFKDDGSDTSSTQSSRQALSPSYSNGEPTLSRVSSCRMIGDVSGISGLASSAPNTPINTSSAGQVRIMYPVVYDDPNDATLENSDIDKHLLDEEVKQINIKTENAKELLRQETENYEDSIREAIQKREAEKEKYEEAKKKAEYMIECAEKEAIEKIESAKKKYNDAKSKAEFMIEYAEREAMRIKAAYDAKEKEKFKQIKWEDIVNGTSSFSENLVIGVGANGIVYKCLVDHMTAAVKVFNSRDDNSAMPFQQELEALGKIRHPHLLKLLGACPDPVSLVYEYMENGSLEEHLFRKNKTKPPIPWFDRFRIAFEVASALVFLHDTKPNPIIHGDLKPANIFLDYNLVSKIGGLLKMSSSEDMGHVGTVHYVDPEYERTGVNSPKSDMYAFGIVILQLLIAKPAKRITYVVGMAIKDDLLMEILDQEAGDWPVEETMELATLGLGCAELRQIDRPDLKEHVMPLLERLKAFSDKAREAAYVGSPAPPSLFICPILTEVMNEPCVAADGYTYDRQSIEKWLASHDTSPMTNMPMSHKFTIPNYTLLSAIMEWKSKI